ncbi:quinone oxidoreductase [Mumia zhuanghuii]|uniref:Quinone oxidoreductase family protein n=2 Tax=Mumia TaxID=1546255 RepID=A0ABW1QHJ9_9ACTN|nr:MULTISPECIES: quinone oxidoreductase [Mumia]KAA1418181.1 quinone oxidoreductase [Mumia zhuanghuii]
MRAIVVNRHGGPEVFEVVERDRPTPASGEVLVELSVSGVNYLDAYQRNGTTPVAAPYVAGVEGVGVVAEVGDAVSGVDVGQRVGWLTGGKGSFADFAVVDAGTVVPVPDGLDDEFAAAVLMQGVTAHYLATDAYAIAAGDTVLVHAAAGGVGQMLTQVAKLRGARVIGTVSTEAKAEAARAAGADHAIAYDGFAETVADLTDGVGVAAVYDGVGAATVDGSIASLAVRGTYVVYGAASGPVPPLELTRLAAGGSLYVTRPTVLHYTRTPEELRGRTDELFAWVRAGDLRVTIGGRYPIARVADAFTALESRQTEGKVLLTH